MFRALGQAFEFGEQRPSTNRRGEAVTLGDFCLKFCGADWRIVQDGRIILGSSDYDYEDRRFFYESDEEPEVEIAYNTEARTLALHLVSQVREGRLIVESVTIGDFAEVTVQLSHGVRIESFASAAEDHDLWFFHNRRTDISCLVGPSGANWGESVRPKSESPEH